MTERPNIIHNASLKPAPDSDAYPATLLGRIDRRYLSHPAVGKVLLVLLAVALIVPSVQFVKRIQEVESSFYRQNKHKTALGRWLADAEALTKIDEGEQPYGFGHWFPLPPTVLISLIPLWKMGFAAAGVTWAALKVVGFFVAMGLLVAALGRTGRAVPLGVLLMTAAFALRPIISDLQHGNLNTFMLIWLALAWVFYTRGRDGLSGLFMALAIVTKITPALALLYFAYKRAWRLVITACIGLVVLIVAMPSLYLGPSRNAEQLKAWYSLMVEPSAVHGFATVTIENQSLGGTGMRLLSNAGLLPVEPPSTDMAAQAGMEVEHMARPTTIAGKMLRPGLAVLTLCLLAGLCRTRSGDRKDVRLWIEFGIVLIAMLLMSERTWKHHGTILPFVYLTVWYVLTCRPWSDRFRAWFVGGLVAQFALLVCSGEFLLGGRIADLLLDGGVFCWGLVLCFVQLAILLRALQQEGRPTASAAARS